MAANLPVPLALRIVHIHSLTGHFAIELLEDGRPAGAHGKYPRYQFLSAAPFWGPGVIRDDAARVASEPRGYSRPIPLDAAHLPAVLGMIEQQRLTPDPYLLLGDNCISFVQKALDLAAPGARVGTLFDADELAATQAGRHAFHRLPLDEKVAVLMAVPATRWRGPTWNLVLDTLTDPRIDEPARRRLAAHRRGAAAGRGDPAGTVHVRGYSQNRGGHETAVAAHARSAPARH